MKALSKQSSHGAVALDPSWKAVLECAALEVFEMMAGVRLKLVEGSATEPKGEQTAMVGLAGALCGMITLRCGRGASTKFASLMLGGDSASDPSTAQDALGELCNMVAGNFKGKIHSLADHCMLSVPTVISGEDYEMSIGEPSEGFTFALTFDSEPIWISLIIHS